MVMFVGNNWYKIDLIWIGMPLVVAMGIIIMFILYFATKGKYRTRPVALIIMAKGSIAPPIHNPLPAHSRDVGTAELYVIAFIIIIVILIIRKFPSSRRARARTWEGLRTYGDTEARALRSNHSPFLELVSDVDCTSNLRS